jgi:hypothetical protein
MILMSRLGPPTPALLLKLGTSPPTVELLLQVVINVWMKVPMVSFLFLVILLILLPLIGLASDHFHYRHACRVVPS